MKPSTYKIEAKKVHIPKGWDLTTQLMRECNIDSRKSEGGKFVSALVYGNKQRNKLRNFLKKYEYDEKLFKKLFYEEHLELEKNESVKYDTNNEIEDMKEQDKPIEISAEAMEELGVRPQSVAKVIGVVYENEFAEEDSVDLEQLYQAVSEQWDDVIDRFDKANEEEADSAKDPDNVQYELDGPMSDGTVGLEELGIVDRDTLHEAILVLSDEKDIADTIGEAADEEDETSEPWVDNTQLDGVDSIEAFATLVEKIAELEGVVPSEQPEETDDEPVEESKAGDYIDIAMNEGYEFVRIEDAMNERYNEGRFAAMNEDKNVDVNAKGETKSISVNFDAPKSTKKNPVSSSQFKACRSKAISDAKALVRDDSAKEVRSIVNKLKMGASAEEINAAIEEINKFGKFAIKSDLLKVLKVALTCAKAMNESADSANSVTANFAKYRKMFESEDNDDKNEPASDNGDGDNNASEPASDSNEEPADNGASDDTNDTAEEADAIIITIKKKEGAEVDDVFEQFKKDLIDCGVEESDIERLDNSEKKNDADKQNDSEKTDEAEGDENAAGDDQSSDNNGNEQTDGNSEDSEEIKVKIDGNSLEALLKFGKEHNIDIEGLAGCEFDVEGGDDTEGEGNDQSKDNTDDANDGGSSNTDGGMDFNWDAIFGSDDDEKK